MPSLGSISPTCAPEATKEVREFADALKGLIRYVCPGATMAKKAKALHVSPSLLSHWLHGRRLPRLEVIDELTRLALEGIAEGREADALARGFAALKSPLEAARESTHRRRHALGRAGSEAAARGDRRNAASGASGEGDRRNSSFRELAGLGVGCSAPQSVKQDLPACLAAVSVADRVGILRCLGADLSESEIGAVADALARAGMREEMESLIRSAESSGRNSLEIAIALGGCR